MVEKNNIIFEFFFPFLFYLIQELSIPVFLSGIPSIYYRSIVRNLDISNFDHPVSNSTPSTFSYTFSIRTRDCIELVVVQNTFFLHG